MENKLPEDFKQKWVAALRSGEYIQCRDGKLIGKTKDGKVTHCVLAVGGELAGIPAHNNSEVYSYFNGLIGFRTTEHLWSMNDRIPNSFPSIADYIEQNL